MIEDFTKLAEDLQAARRAASDVRGRAESDDGLVAVTVDGDGGLVGLELDPRIYRTPDSSALAETITKTFAGAVEDATRRAFAVMRTTMLPGADEETADLVIGPVLEQIRRRKERSA
jgi:DNA-binding protein YbaB